MRVKKNKYVADKIKKIMAEGKPMKQAVAIALSMYKRKMKSSIFAPWHYSTRLTEELNLCRREASRLAVVWSCLR